MGIALMSSIEAGRAAQGFGGLGGNRNLALTLLRGEELRVRVKMNHVRVEQDRVAITTGLAH